MEEYLLTVIVPANDTRVFPIPSEGIAGVYATSAITLTWDFNGASGDLVTSAAWEPCGGFHPAKTSKLILDNSAGSSAVSVTVRCYEKG